MVNDYNNLVVKAYTSNIRSTLIIDDKFPTYDDLASGNGDFADKTRAQALFRAFRSKGWTCDIENDVDKALAGEMPNHLYQSDLVVLDYHLTEGDDEDGSKAIEFLKHLIETPHFNLVVLHTAAPDLKTIAFEIFLHLKKQKIKDEQAYTDIPELVYNVESDNENFFNDLKNSVFPDDLIRFLQNEKLSNENFPSLGSVLNSVKIDDQDLVLTFRQNRRKIMEYILFHKLEEYSVNYGDISEVFIDINSEPIWIEAGNLFLAIVEKGVAPDNVIEKLETALVNWKPEPVRLIVTNFQNYIEKNGIAYARKLLPNKETNAAWVFNALTNNSEDESLSDLSKKLFSYLGDKVLGDCSYTNCELFKSLKIKGATEVIKEHYCLDPEESNKKQELYKLLNVYQCSHNVVTKHLTTGLIIKELNTEPGSENCCWMVLNCSCDLVPSQKSGWNKSLDPWRPFTAVKLAPAGIEVALKKANDANYIFIDIDGEAKAFCFISGNSNPHYEVFYSNDSGLLLEDNIVECQSFTKSVRSKPRLKAISFQAISQLRYEFACRFLNQLANHKSRIGVDFIALP